jgi:hypothetical protein
MIAFNKTRIGVLYLFISILIFACDPGGHFILIDSGGSDKIIQFNSVNVKFSLFALWGGAGYLSCTIQSNGDAIIFPKNLEILRYYCPVSYKTYRDKKEIKQDQLELEPSSTVLEYELRLGPPFKRQDKIILYAKNFIYANGKYYDLDSLVFIRP